jgi:signal transduction histidine kinase
VSRQLLATYLALALVVLAALEIPLGLTYSRTERRDLTSRIEHDALAMASISEETLEKNRRTPLPGVANAANSYARDTGGRIVVVDKRGRSVLDTASGSLAGRDFSTRPEIAAALQGRTVSGQRYSQTLGTNLIYVAVPVGSGGVVRGAARVTYPSSALDSRVRRYWLLLAAIAGVVLVAVALVGLRFTRTLTRPLAQLEDAVAAAAEGDLTARAPTDAGPPEVRELAQRFNEMVSRLEALLESQQEFVADASHQLRTPLTALRLRLENLGHGTSPPDRANVEAALSELQRLSGLVDALLALARADATESRPTVVDLVRVVRQRLAIWKPQAEARAVELVDDVAPGLKAHATPESLDQVLDNLLSNALAATPNGKRVTVGGLRTGHRVMLRVVDEGPGMTETQRARAFDRFWRATDGRSGSGLGLPIARRLVEADGGELELAEAPGGGLEARIRLRAG